jgi:hypothetical protein
MKLILALAVLVVAALPLAFGQPHQAPATQDKTAQ